MFEGSENDSDESANHENREKSRTRLLMRIHGLEAEGELYPLEPSVAIQLKPQCPESEEGFSTNFVSMVEKCRDFLEKDHCNIADSYFLKLYNIMKGSACFR